MNRILNKLYYNLDNIAAYSSIDQLYTHAKKIIPSIKKSSVKAWLSKQKSYSLHRSPIRKFQRSQFVSSEIDRYWSIDLMDITKYSKFNDSYKFLFVAIDNLSKFAFIEPIKDKKPLSIIRAFKNILKSGRKPKFLISDSGTEFVNRSFQSLLDMHNIKLYIMRNTEVKAAIAERFIRTIKTKIFKYLTDSKSLKFIDKLPLILKNYNNSLHSRTKFKPIDVNTSNQYDAFLNLYRDRNENKTANFKIGDKVRIMKLKGTFEKGYLRNWTDEIFTVNKILNTLPFKRYLIRDSNNIQLLGSFYEKELLKI